MLTGMLIKDYPTFHDREDVGERGALQVCDKAPYAAGTTVSTEAFEFRQTSVPAA